MTQFYAKAADGSRLYPFESTFGVHDDSLLDGVKLLAQPTSSYKSVYFLNVPADHEGPVRFERPGQRELAGFTRSHHAPVNLIDSGVLPAELTLDAFTALRGSFGYTDEDEDEWLLERWYGRKFTDPAPTIETISLDDYEPFPLDLTMSIDDLKDPAGLWRVNPAYLVFGHQFGPALPGELMVNREDFGRAVEALLKPGVQVWNHKFRDGVIDGHFSIGYSDNRTHTYTQPKEGRRKQPPPRQIVSQHRVDFAYPIPASFKAASLQQASEAYDIAVGEIAAAINKPRSLVVCGHCNGTGYVQKDA